MSQYEYLLDWIPCLVQVPHDSHKPKFWQSSFAKSNRRVWPPETWRDQTKYLDEGFKWSITVVRNGWTRDICLKFGAKKLLNLNTAKKAMKFMSSHVLSTTHRSITEVDIFSKTDRNSSGICRYNPLSVKHPHGFPFLGSAKGVQRKSWRKSTKSNSH